MRNTALRGTCVALLFILSGCLGNKGKPQERFPFVFQGYQKHNSKRYIAYFDGKRIKRIDEDGKKGTHRGVYDPQYMVNGNGLDIVYVDYFDHAGHYATYNLKTKKNALFTNLLKF